MTAAASISSGGSPRESLPVKSSLARRKFSIAIPNRVINGNGALKTPTQSLRTPDEAYSSNNEGILGQHGRRRTMSNSSGDPDAMESVADGESESANPRKRVNGETPDYPRRRATIAVCLRLVT